MQRATIRRVFRKQAQQIPCHARRRWPAQKVDNQESNLVKALLALFFCADWNKNQQNHPLILLEVFVSTPRGLCNEVVLQNGFIVRFHA